MNGTPSVSIVLVNWNSFNDTLECLDSLAHVAYDNFSVVVIDNGSLKDEAKIIQDAFPSITLLKTERNLGFTGGHNLGIQHALKVGADYILCLNTDTIVAPDFLDHLVKAAETDPKIGIVTSAIYSYEQPDTLFAVGCWLALGETPLAGHINNIAELESPNREAIDVPFAEGCVLMLRDSTARETSGFDEGFFAYAEDADLCLRAQKLGWRCVVAPQARVWHKLEGKDKAESGYMSPGAVYYSRRNWYRLVNRHGTREQLKSFTTAERDTLKLEWKALLVKCIVSGTTRQAIKKRSDLINHTLAVICGRLGCDGSRNRWLIMENFISLIVIKIFRIFVVSGRSSFLMRKAIRFRFTR